MDGGDREVNNEWGKERVGELAAMQVGDTLQWFSVVGEAVAMDDASSN